MLFMNGIAIHQACERHARHPILGRATRFLLAFMEDVNSHSDGWASWGAPVRSAERLITLVNGPKENVDEDALRRAVAPIKSFYTRNGARYGMTLPEIDTPPQTTDLGSAPAPLRAPTAESTQPHQHSLLWE